MEAVRNARPATTVVKVAALRTRALSVIWPL